MEITIPSPITGGKTRYIRTISVAEIVKKYSDFDVTPYFHGLNEISVYECLDTTYAFFYPFTVAGNGSYYSYLSKYKLYYIPWKWEHDIADTVLHKGDRVLEIGCAKGDFLEKELQKGVKCFGVELNKEAGAIAKTKGITIYDTDLTKLSIAPSSQFDTVCSFQVLEHISDVRAFLTQSISLIKNGGKMIISVPNNDSFIHKSPNGFLSIPPHHMGIWNEHALRSLERYFNITLESIYYEPLQKYHYRYYYQVLFGDTLLPLGLLGKIINKLLFELLAKWIIMICASRIKGHSIVAIYKKK